MENPPANSHKLLLALSGGGYRAMLFHVGALWRLNELGELRRLTHVSSVSGGSIVAGMLAAHWHQLDFDSQGIACGFREKIAQSLIRLTDYTIDWPAALIGLLPFLSPADILAHFYRWRLLGNTTLADLPASPKFIFNATNLQTGAVWSFEKERMGDAAVGMVREPKVLLAKVVAASSAFPPFLSPLRLSLGSAAWEPPRRNSLSRPYYDVAVGISQINEEELHRFRKQVVLVDGGVADNLGVAALWNTEGELYLSDGGGTPAHCALPPHNWLGLMIRIVSLIHQQPSQLRAYTAISRFAEHDSRGLASLSRALRGDGAYWKMQWPPESHDDVSFPEVNAEDIRKLAAMGTRLKALKADSKMRLVNWGYVAANRSLPYVARLWRKGGAAVFNEDRLPYPAAGFGPGSVSKR